jgi:hypothetical protein
MPSTLQPSRFPVGLAAAAMLFSIVLAGCNTTKKMNVGAVSQDGYLQAVDQSTSSALKYDFSSDVSAGEARPYTKGYKKQYDAFTQLVRHDMPGRVDSLNRQYLEKRTGGIDPTAPVEVSVHYRDFKISKWVPGDKGEKLQEAASGEKPMSKYAAKMSASVSLRKNGAVKDSTTIQVEVEDEVPAGGKKTDWAKLTARLIQKHLDALGTFMSKNDM